MASRGPASAEVIGLRPPDAEQTIVLSKTGVVVEFSRDDFSIVARCLGLKQAQHYIATETGHSPESPLVDAFQLSYVAAALLDLGRASVRLERERELRASIVRDVWSAEGCRGRCRSFGRIYRLTASGPSFFFRVTDETVNDWE